MSTFNGITKEIPFVSFDRFDKHNLNSNVFFLSHCHSDHMFGLENTDFNGPLYTSAVSKIFVKYQYPHITNVISLEIGVPTIIEYSTEEGNRIIKNKLIVTTIPAGHCPGSVMFVLEINNLRILYTGDFRLRLKDIQKICAFKSYNKGEILRFNAIYIDSTFFDIEYFDFPTQFESVDEICKIIKNWIIKGKQYIILLKTPAKYGSEYLYIEIAKRLKMKIHVNSTELAKYKHFSEMDNCVTDDPKGIQIHACVTNSTKQFKSPACTNINSNFLRVIRPSALIWKNWHPGNDIITKCSDEIYRACYSSHSSYNELKDFILYLKPDRIELNVVPENYDKKMKMLETLQELLLEYNKTDDNTLKPNLNVFTCLNKIAAKQKKYTSTVNINTLRMEDNDDEEDDQEISNIPIKRRK